MLPFATDLDLALWEPTLFTDPLPIATRRLHQLPATLAGQTLTLTAASLAALGITSDTIPNTILLLQLFTTATPPVLIDALLTEITALPTDTTLTLSALRARTSDPQIPPAITIPTGTTLLASLNTYTALADTISDALFASLHIASDRDTTPTPETLWGFRAATAFGTLAAAFRSISPPTPASTAKQSTYDTLHQLARKAISATLDLNNDGHPDVHLTPSQRTLYRE